MFTCDILLETAFFQKVSLQQSTILGCLVSAVLALVIGYNVFHKLEKKFILHI